MNLSSLKEKAKNLFAGKREAAEHGTDDASAATEDSVGQEDQVDSAAQEAEGKVNEQAGSPDPAASPGEPPSPPAASGPETGGTAQ